MIFGDPTGINPIPTYGYGVGYGRSYGSTGG